MSLIPLAVIIIYAGWKLHAEIIEAFLALFFLFYSYRALRMQQPPGDQEPRRAETSSHSTPARVSAVGGK